MSSPSFQNLTEALRASPLSTLRQLAKRFEEDDHGLWRLGLLLDTAEFCIKFRAAYVLAECNRFKIDVLPMLGQGENGKSDFRKPTLGNWASLLHKGSEKLGNRNILFRKLLIPKYPADLVDARNKRAHGATLTASDADSLADHLAGAVLEIANPLCNSVATGEGNRSNGWDLLDEPIFVLPDRNGCQPSQRWSAPYLRSAPGFKLDLFPWILQDAAQQSLYFFNRDNDNGPLDYLDYANGEEYDVSKEDIGARIQDALKPYFFAPRRSYSYSPIIAEYTAHFVGRDEELRMLRTFAEDGGPKVLLLLGPPGFGKSALLANFAKDSDLLRAFIRANDPKAPKEPKKVLSNLKSGLAERQNPPADPQRMLVVIIDGLDEAQAPETLLESLHRDRDFQSCRFIIGSQPHLASEVTGIFGADNVRSEPLNGLPREAVQKLADLFEVRLTDGQLTALLEKTKGGGLFVTQFFKAFEGRTLADEDIVAIPGEIETYWRQLLERGRSAGDAYLKDFAVLRKLAKQAFAKVLDGADVPLGKQALMPAFDKEIESLLANQLPVLLGILAESPVGLAESQLSEIVRDPKVVESGLEHLGGLVEMESTERGDRLRICHHSLRQFLQKEYLCAVVESRKLLKDWAQAFSSDPTGDRAKVHIHVCDQDTKQQLLGDWSFFELYLAAWGVDETTEIYDAGMRHADFGALPRQLLVDLASTQAKFPVDERGGGRVAVDYRARNDEYESNKAIEAAGHFELDEPNNPGETEADDVAETLEFHSRRDERARSFQVGTLPDDWFSDWNSCGPAIEEIRAGYETAFDRPVPDANLGDDGTIARIQRFLRDCYRQLSVDKPDIALIAYNSGVFRNTERDQHLQERLNQRSGYWIERLYRNAGAPHAGAEVSFVPEKPSVLVAASAGIACWQRSERDDARVFEFVTGEWRSRSRLPKSISQDGSELTLNYLCISHDGTKMLAKAWTQNRLARISRLVLIEPDGPGEPVITDVVLPPEAEPSEVRFQDATLDLSLLVLGFDNRLVLVNTRDNKWSDFRVHDFGPQDHARITSDGRIVFVRRKYGCFEAMDTVTMTFLGFGKGPGESEDIGFAISPNGRFYAEKGYVSIMDPEFGAVDVRMFEHSRNQDCAAFSVDSRILAIASGPILRVYDVREGGQIGEIPLRESCSKIALSPDGAIAVLVTATEGLIVVDLTKSGAQPECLLESEYRYIRSGSRVPLFWTEDQERVFKLRSALAGIERENVDFDIEKVCQWNAPCSFELDPVFEACGAIWFRIPGEFLSFSMASRTNKEEVEKITVEACNELRASIEGLAAELSGLRKAERAYLNELILPSVDYFHPINETQIALALSPNTFAILDGMSRRITHWNSWPVSSQQLNGYDAFFADESRAYALVSCAAMVVWDWKEDGEVRRFEFKSVYDRTVMNRCGEHFVIRLYESGKATGVSRLDLREGRIVDVVVDLGGYRWGQHHVPVEGGPLLLASVEPQSSQGCDPQRLVLIDVASGAVLGYIDFESGINGLFRLDGESYGVELGNGSVEVIRVIPALG